MACHSVKIFGIGKEERTRAIGKRVFRDEAARFKGLLGSCGYSQVSPAQRRVVNFDGDSLGFFAKTREGIGLAFEILDAPARGNARDTVYITSMLEMNISFSLEGVLRAFPERAHFSLPNTGGQPEKYFTYCAFLVPKTDISMIEGNTGFLLDAFMGKGILLQALKGKGILLNAFRDSKILDALMADAQVGDSEDIRKMNDSIGKMNDSIRTIEGMRAKQGEIIREEADAFIISLEKKIAMLENKIANIQRDAGQPIEIIRSDPKLAAAMRFVAMKG